MEVLRVGASFISCRGSCHHINILQVKLFLKKPSTYFAGSMQFNIVSPLVCASFASELRARDQTSKFQIRPPSRFCRNPWPHRRKMDMATLSPQGLCENSLGISLLALKEKKWLGKLGPLLPWSGAGCMVLHSAAFPPVNKQFFLAVTSV